MSRTIPAVICTAFNRRRSHAVVALLALGGTASVMSCKGTEPFVAVPHFISFNVESLSFSLDGTAKKITVITIFDPVTHKIPIAVPVPNISILRPPLGIRPTVPSKVEFAEGMAALSPGDAANRALGILFGANDAVTGSGSLDVLRYGRDVIARLRD